MVSGRERAGKQEDEGTEGPEMLGRGQGGNEADSQEKYGGEGVRSLTGDGEGAVPTH